MTKLMMPYPFKSISSSIEVSTHQVESRLAYIKRNREKKDLEFKEFLKMFLKVKE